MKNLNNGFNNKKYPLKIGKPLFKIHKGEIQVFWCISKYKKNYIWINYSNSKRNSRIWDRPDEKYNFCLQIRGIIEIDTAYIGKKLWGNLYLTRLFGKDFHICTDTENGCDMQSN